MLKDATKNKVRSRTMSKRIGTKRRNAAADAMTFMHLTAGKWISQALAIAADLGIADLLKEGAKTSADIACSTGASEDARWRASGCSPNPKTGSLA